MDSVITEDLYDSLCGEIYLTSQGNMMFHCTLCENRFQSFENYVAHVSDEHCVFKLKDDMDMKYDEENNYEDNDPVLDENEFIDTCETDSLNSLQLDIPSIESSNIESSNHSIGNSEQDEMVTLPQETVTVEINLDNDKLPNRLPSKRRKRGAEGRIHKCPQCDFACNDRSNLIGHIRRHSANKPHKCDECTKAFHTRTELKQHKRSHTGERPFLCTHCGRAFTTASKLTGHIKKHLNIRDHVCQICDLRFYKLRQLRDHMAVHSDDRPYKCSSCEATFKRPTELKNHNKLHENKRAYECKLCSAKFNQGPGLYSHMKNKHAMAASETTKIQE